jgi:hypothetical protein
MTRAVGCWRVLTMALALGAATSALAADAGAWLVSKSSGEVWMTTTGAQPASLGQDEVLKPGDTIRTGRNGRVLLTRGEETILISPNSVIGLPAMAKDGLETTIVQRAGSILLDVEKRNVKHFEVETPYLAAVVKGTNFRVSVNAASTSVGVLRGQVEVADFKSGQIAQVMPGQMATAFANGKAGLSLSGSGTFNPIEQGKPRASSFERITVPKSGLASPRSAANGQSIRAVGHAASLPRSQRDAGNASVRSRAMRISTALGEVRLDFHKVTHGLAHGSIVPSGSSRSASNKDTVWTSPQAGSTTGNEAGSNNSAATSTNATTGSGVAAQVAAAAASASNSGNVNGNNGNGNNGSGQGNGSGNGNGNGNGKANGNGNGNGNNGNGNGNGNGNNGNGKGNGNGNGNGNNGHGH